MEIARDIPCLNVSPKPYDRLEHPCGFRGSRWLCGRGNRRPSHGRALRSCSIVMKRIWLVDRAFARPRRLRASIHHLAKMWTNLSCEVPT